MTHMDTTVTQTCAFCDDPIAASRGVDKRTGHRKFVKYCSDRCRRDACDKRQLPLCPACGVNQMSHRYGKTCCECRSAERVWTRERISDAIRDYADQYGHPPSARDWNPSQARADYRDDVSDRFYEDGCWPHLNTVQAAFGSWNAAISAAGLVPLEQGHKYSDLVPRQHGTNAKYARGCRCAECRAAGSEYNRSRYLLRLAEVSA